MFYNNFAMIFDNCFFPLLSVPRLRNFGWNAVRVLVCHEAAILVLGLNVSVDEFHEKKLLERHPFVEDLLRIVYRELCEIVAD